MSLRHRLGPLTIFDWKPRGKCIQTGVCSIAWTNALLKSIEHVIQFNVNASIKKSRTELHATTGAKVSGSPSSKSPRTQYRALYLLICPSGVRFLRNTQVPGKTRVLAVDVSTSTQVPFFSRLAISFAAASIHLSTLSMSDMASSYVSVLGSDGVALCAIAGGSRPFSVKIQA